LYSVDADGESLSNKTSVEDFASKVEEMIGSLIRVHLIDGRIIIGKLVSVDPDYLNMIIEEIASTEDEIALTLIPGTSISYARFIIPKSVKEPNIEEKILSLLEKEPNLSVKEIAKILNLEPKRVRSALRRLKRKGLIKSGDETPERAGRTKP